LWLILYGYFMKLVVADNLAPLVKELRGDLAGGPVADLWLLLYAAVLMMYADFGGYSSIARGLGKLMGFELTANFRRPLFAANPPDFWRRWHVTLSDWFRDYVFSPLVGLASRWTAGRAGRTRVAVAVAAGATLILCGLWHGPAWSYVGFGAFHAAILIGYYALRPRLRRAAPRQGPARWLWRGALAFVAFHVLSFAAVIFVVPDPEDWLLIVRRVLSEVPRWQGGADWQTLLLFGGILMVAEAWQEKTENPLAPMAAAPDGRAPPLRRWLAYAALIALIVLCGATGTNEFIYFQF
jgi:D-alanyl-lipoteichoic acid acyltransferase DltB (MBOAT superfamily)